MATESVATATRPADVGLKTRDGADRRHLGVRDLDHRLRLAVRRVLRRAGGGRGRAIWAGSSPESWSSSWPSSTPSSAGCTRSRAERPGSRTSRSAASPASRSASSPGCRRSRSRRSSASRSMQYASYYWHGLLQPDHEATSPRLGFAMTVVLMAIFTAINFLGHAPVRPGQQRHHLVEGRDPGPDHHRPAVQVPRRQLQRRRRLHAWRDQGRVRARIAGRGHHVRLLSASSRPTSWLGRSRTRGATCRGRSSWRS